MGTHVWGDKWFKKNGKKLGQAINFCTTNWRRFGRIGSHGKEKFGTFRHHPVFYDIGWPIHSLVKPGYAYYQWPKPIYRAELFLGRLLKYTKLDYPIIKYQQFVYNSVLQIACKKWPKIKEEILDDGAWPVDELVKPNMFGPIDGKKLHDKYWTTTKHSKSNSND